MQFKKQLLVVKSSSMQRTVGQKSMLACKAQIATRCIRASWCFKLLNLTYYVVGLSKSHSSTLYSLVVWVLQYSTRHLLIDSLLIRLRLYYRKGKFFFAVVAKGIRPHPNRTCYETNYDVVLCEFLCCQNCQRKFFRLGRIHVNTFSIWNNNLEGWRK